jgi:hypothetical protein
VKGPLSKAILLGKSPPSIFVMLLLFSPSITEIWPAKGEDRKVETKALEIVALGKKARLVNYLIFTRMAKQKILVLRFYTCLR